jgi:hypothetical protein
LRRTEALIDNLARSGNASAMETLIADFRALKAACASTPPAPDSNSYKAHYLAACAIRRKLALSNPLLDFDSILCVARGTFEGSVRSNACGADQAQGDVTSEKRARTERPTKEDFPGRGVLYFSPLVAGKPKVLHAQTGTDVKEWTI